MFMCFLSMIIWSLVSSLSITPVKKTPLHPVLTVVEPFTKTRLHLVGVSHGSKASASLVKETIHKTKPSAVILELCEERFISVSMEAQLRPRNNATLEKVYDTKMSSLSASSATAKQNASLPLLQLTAAQQIFSAIRFASAQGIAGGAFVMMGLLIGAFQRITRASTGDEFLTAMREAEELSIPVLLADAAQNETLRSIRRVVSPEALRPDTVLDEICSFSFSSLGTQGVMPKKFSRAVSPGEDKNNEWLNIPSVYLESNDLGKSLLPLFLVALSPYLFELKDVIGLDVPSPVGGSETFSLWSLIMETWNHSQLAMSLADIKEQALKVTEIALDSLSVLFLVRMSKVIGAERDDIMARNLQQMCKQYPDKDVVVVIGMLHCNGIARWLMSGKDPYISQR